MLVTGAGDASGAFAADLLSALLLAACFFGCCSRQGFSEQTRLFRSALLASLVLLTGWIMLGPLDNLARTQAAWHMTQHMALIVVIAPCWVLLAFSRSPQAANNRGARRAGWLDCLLRRPMLSAYLHGVVIWFWHIPWFYVWALQDPWIHLLEQWSFLLSAVWFWAACLLSVQRYAEDARKAGYALLGLLLTLMHTGFLGAFLTFAASPLYGEGRVLENQQLAGLLMWVLGAVPYIAAACWLALKWYQAMRNGWHDAPKRY